MDTSYLNYLDSISSDHKYPTFFNETSMYDPKNKYSLTAEDIYGIKVDELSKKDKNYNNGVYYDMYDSNNPIGKKIGNISHMPHLGHYNNSNKYNDQHYINNHYNQNKYLRSTIPLHYNLLYPNQKMNNDINIKKIIQKKKKNSVFYILLIILFTQFMTIFTLLSRGNSNNDFFEKYLLLKGGINNSG